MNKDIRAIKLLSDTREIIGQYMDGLLTESEAVKLIREGTQNYMTPSEEDAFVKYHERKSQEQQEFAEGEYAREHLNRGLDFVQEEIAKVA